MKFEPTILEGAWLITPDRIEDDRGFFARTWCVREFESHGLETDLVQCNVSCNKKAGTLRGMHWQAAPYPETKLVRCTSGAVFDVIVDVRPQSDTFGRWQGFKLCAASQNLLYIPAGMAHGFLTLTEHSEIFYQMSEYFVPELSRGVHWADSDLNIEWPTDVRVISERDASLPSFANEFLQSDGKQNVA